jgi:enoyl-CoA hydratase/carnithine racemase
MIFSENRSALFQIMRYGRNGAGFGRSGHGRVCWHGQCCGSHLFGTEQPMATLTCERTGHLAYVRLNRPETGNRFSMEMFRALAGLFTALDADPSIRCLLLTAEGPDFSLGVDVQNVLPCWAAGKSPFEDHVINPFGTTGPRRRKPLVTVVQGQCFNAGLELVLASDICIAADNSRFAFHEMRFGVYPFGGGLFRLIRAAGWNAAMRHSLTAKEFCADEALRMNVVALTAPLAEAEATGLALAHDICRNAPLAVQAALAQAQTWADHGEAAALAHSVPDIIRLLNSRDAAEAMRAMAEGRPPVFSGQ